MNNDNMDIKDYLNTVNCYYNGKIITDMITILHYIVEEDPKFKIVNKIDEVKEIKDVEEIIIKDTLIGSITNFNILLINLLNGKKKYNTIKVK